MPFFFDTVSFDTAPSDVLCKTKSCDLECSLPIIDLSSTAETTNLELDLKPKKMIQSLKK